MLLPQLPELPRNKADLEEVLFPKQHGKLPVTKEIYMNFCVRLPLQAQKYLVEADGSALPCSVGHFLLDEHQEYGLDGLAAAEDDLRQKVLPLSKVFYGDVTFILGYIAAGSRFEWVYIGERGGKELEKVGPILDLASERDRFLFLLSLGHACQLLTKMHRSIPEVPGHRGMFSEEYSKEDKRTFIFYQDKVFKCIYDFPGYSAKYGTDIDLIQAAYEAAKQCKFLPQTVLAPTVKRGIYKVEFTPLGYGSTLQSEEECKVMARCVCEALSVLHSQGLVHKDIRPPNIVQLSPTAFILIDLEAVGKFPFKISESKFFSHWDYDMFEEREEELEYTLYSDMYSLGKVLANALAPSARTVNAQDFIEKLMAKKLSSSQALQHRWLSDVDDRTDK